MRQLAFIAFQELIEKSISVLEKHGIALKWNDIKVYEGSRN